jgi:hypothetical protein
MLLCAAVVRSVRGNQHSALDDTLVVADDRCDETVQPVLPALSMTTSGAHSAPGGR